MIGQRVKIDELAPNKYKFDSGAVPQVLVADGTDQPMEFRGTVSHENGRQFLENGEYEGRHGPTDAREPSQLCCCSKNIRSKPILPTLPHVTAVI